MKKKKRHTHPSSQGSTMVKRRTPAPSPTPSPGEAEPHSGSAILESELKEDPRLAVPISDLLWKTVCLFLAFTILMAVAFIAVVQTADWNSAIVVVVLLLSGLSMTFYFLLRHMASTSAVQRVLLAGGLTVGTGLLVKATVAFDFRFGQDVPWHLHVKTDEINLGIAVCGVMIIAMTFRTILTMHLSQGGSTRQ